MLAPTLFLAGLTLATVAIGALAGPWWGVLVAGVVLSTLGVLTAAQDRAAKASSTAAPKRDEEPQR